MLKKIGTTGIAAVLLAIPVLAVIGMSLVKSEVGMASEIGIQEPVLATIDYSAVPQSVVDDAVSLAADFYGDSQEKIQKFVDELLASYAEASQQDVVIIFNSGGLGWNLTSETPGWASILDGTVEELEGLGYKTMVMNYRRTGSGLTGVVSEVIEAIRRYPHKVKDLVCRVEFISDHLPDLKIIIAGESTGTVITDKTMNLLRDRDQIYSIQTGTPFWHKPSMLDRTLLMNSNGRGIDTFSYGNIPAMLWATAKGWLGLITPEDNPGNILSWLRAPGHHYSWQYPGIHSEVIQFIDRNFGRGDA